MLTLINIWRAKKSKKKHGRAHTNNGKHARITGNTRDLREKRARFTGNMREKNGKHARKKTGNTHTIGNHTHTRSGTTRTHDQEPHAHEPRARIEPRKCLGAPVPYIRARVMCVRRPRTQGGAPSFIRKNSSIRIFIGLRSMISAIINTCL